MAAINFPTATSNGQTFTADTGVIYTYVGTPPNGFWSGTFATQGLTTLDGRYIAKNDGNTRQTIQTQGLNFNNGTSDTILIDAVNSKIGVGTSSPRGNLHLNSSTATRIDLTNTATGTASSDGSTISIDGTTGALNIIQREAQPINFSTSNTQVARIDSSGRVGIGETNPASLLHLSSASSPSLRLQDTTNDCILLLYSQNTNSHIGTSSNHELFFDTNGSQRMMITTGGNVGIGNTAPSAKLQIEGTSDQLKLTYTSIASYIHEVHSNGDYSVSKDSSERLRIDSSGNVGIGRTSASSRLDLQAASGRTQITLRNVGNTSDASTFVAAEEMTSSNADLILAARHNVRFFSNLVEKMRIDSTGNVGIGTTSASAKLDVNGNVQFGDGGGFDMNINGTRHQFSIGGSEKMRLTSAGKLGIGTSGPDGTVHVHTNSAGSVTPQSGADDLVVENSGDCGISILTAAGNNTSAVIFGAPADSVGAAIRWNDSTGEMGIGPDKAGAHFRFNSGDGAEAMRIDSSGRLLVGTSSARTAGAGGHAELQVKSPSSVTSDQVVIAAKFQANTSTSNSECLIACSAGYDISANDTEGQVLFGAVRGGTGNQAGFIVKTGTSNTEQLRIDSSGKVGIGESSMDALLVIKGNSDASTTPSIRLKDGTDTREAWITNASGDLSLNVGGDDNVAHGTLKIFDSGILDFAQGANARLRVDTSGYLLIGKTSSNSANAGVEIRPSGEIALTRGGDLLTTRRVSTEGTHLSFRNISGTVVGNIVTTSSATAYNTSSDYRLKENVELLTGAIPRVKLLPVKRFNFIGNDQTVDGFLAHEAAVVVPESVTGTHNEVDGDGNPVYQSIDQAKLVPLLTAALQEAISRIETLETEVAALKSA